MFKPVLNAAARQLPRLLLLSGAAWFSMAPSADAQDPLAGDMIDGSVMLAPGEVLMDPYGDPSIGMSPPGELGYGPQHHGHHGGGHHRAGHRHAPLTGGLVQGPVSADLCFGGCQPGYYVRAEALYMRRTGHEGLTLSQDFALDEFDFEIGPRLTLGRLFDCVNGYEVVYTGLFDEWDQLAVSNTGGTSLLTWAGPGGTPASLAALTGAEPQQQAYRVDYHSYEFNRTYRGWDVVNLLIGGRVIDYSEDYIFTSSEGAAGGVLGTATENLLIGGQVGLDLAYPLAQRVWSTVKGRAGLFANFAESQTILADSALTDFAINNEADDEDISGLLEFGVGVRYRLAQRAWLTGGYEAIYLHDVATAPDQLFLSVGPGLGISTRIDDEVFIHGLTLGAEVFF